MKNLENHILHLIATHNCVILPGVGAFLAYNVPAKYNAEEQIFMPPHRTLGFNPQITIDDTLLVSDYMSSGKLTYDKAADAMKHDIDTLRNILSRKGTARFGELGTFFMDINGCITFTPEDNCIDDAYNYGLEPLNIKQLHKQQEKDIVIKRRDLRKFVAAAAAIVLTFLFVTPVSEQMFNKNLKASLSDFASSEQISLMQQLTTSAPAQVANDAQCEIQPVDFSQTAAHNSATTAIKEEPLATAETTNNIVGTQPTHYIIVASCPNADNAQLAIKELSAKMTAEYTIVQCGKRHRIAISSYATAGEAQSNLAQYQQTFPDAWVLTY